MSTTLRTLICSCRYLQEGDPGLALVLTIMCAQYHTRLRPSNVETEAVYGYLGIGGGAAGLGGAVGRRQGGPRRTGRRGAAECVVHDKFPRTAED